MRNGTPGGRAHGAYLESAKEEHVVSFASIWVSNDQCQQCLWVGSGMDVLFQALLCFFQTDISAVMDAERESHLVRKHLGTRPGLKLISLARIPYFMFANDARRNEVLDSVLFDLFGLFVCFSMLVR